MPASPARRRAEASREKSINRDATAPPAISAIRIPTIAPFGSKGEAPARTAAARCRSMRPTSRSSATSPGRTSRPPSSSGFVEQVVATINRALVNVPRDRVRLHVCWGNSKSPHDCDVPLDDILPALQQANVGGFVAAVRQSAPRPRVSLLRQRIRSRTTRVLVAGVIDSLTNFVEHPEVVADRIERVAAVVGDPTRVLAGTDCGFDTSAGWGRVAEDVVWAKLASLRDGARIASERLFARGR